MHAFLITGKNQRSREEKIEDLAREYKAVTTIYIEPEKASYTIGQIRNLISDLKIKSPTIRSIVLKDANKLTQEAGNAFLKTLEEPPSNTIIILTAPNRDSVLDTISSRCAEINLGPQTSELSEKELKEALEEFEKLQNSSVGERLTIVDKLDDRQKAQDFLTGQIYAAREKLATNPENKSALLLEKLLETKKDIDSSINTKLALTELLLSY